VRIGRNGAALSATVCLLTAASASAATVTTATIDSCLADITCSKYNGGTPVPVTLVTGVAGEANQLSITVTAPLG
jgi:hypothetical protein